MKRLLVPNPVSTQSLSRRSRPLLVLPSVARLLLLIQMTLSVSADVLHYSLVNDWSDSQNPHGPWSYNLNNAPITTFQPFWWGQAGWGYNYLGDGCIIRGSAPTGTDPFGNPVPAANDWQPGDVMMHALSIPYGGDSTFLNVTWTSPVAGVLDISGRAWDGLIQSDRDVAWSLSVGGQLVAQRSSVQGLFRSDSAAQFANNLLAGQTLTGIPVTQGEIVQFQVATDTYYGEFLGVQTELAVTTVPEPGTCILLFLACVGLLYRRRWLVADGRGA